MADEQAKPDETFKPDAVHREIASQGFLAHLMLQFSVAWLFLTRIPLPGWWNTPEPSTPATEAYGAEEGVAPREDAAQHQGNTPATAPALDKGKTMLALADTVRAWPVVGLLIGAMAGVALWLAAHAGLSPLAASFVALIVAALATGVLHEDGLADLADGFGGGADKTAKLRIMRDSHIGTYGVLALLLGVGVKASSLGGFNSPALAAGALIGAHALSRAVLPMMMVMMIPVRRSGLGKGAGQPKREDAVMAAAIGVLIAVLALGFGPGLVASVLAALAAAGVGWLAQRQIGGYTGDVLGAAQQAAEIVVLAGLAVGLRTVFYA